MMRAAGGARRAVRRAGRLCSPLPQGSVIRRRSRSSVEVLAPDARALGEPEPASIAMEEVGDEAEGDGERIDDEGDLAPGGDEGWTRRGQRQGETGAGGLKCD